MSAFTEIKFSHFEDIGGIFSEMLEQTFFMHNEVPQETTM